MRNQPLKRREQEQYSRNTRNVHSVSNFAKYNFLAAALEERKIQVEATVEVVRFLNYHASQQSHLRHWLVYFVISTRSATFKDLEVSTNETESYPRTSKIGWYNDAYQGHSGRGSMRSIALS